MNKHLVVQVYAALVEHIVAHGKSPTVRELCIAANRTGEKEVWYALQVLEHIGAIRWPVNKLGIHTRRGIELLVPLKEPAIVPIVGYLNAPADFVPGSRWIEFHEDGRVIVNKGEEQWKGLALCPWQSNGK